MKAHVNNSSIRKIHKQRNLAMTNMFVGTCKKKIYIYIIIISLVEASSETQGRSVESGKTAAKVLKNGRQSPWDATLKKLVRRLIRRLVCDLAQKIFLCPTRGLPVNSTVRVHV